jgi:hypothetical protein
MVEPPKPAPPPPAKKPGAGPSDEPGGEDKPKKVLKPAPSSGRSIGRGIIVAAVLIAGAWIYAAATAPRFMLAPAGTQDNTFMYRRDQRTGAVHFCTTQQCVELPVRAQ